MKSTPVIQPTNLDCAYLAGIIDGEGSIMALVNARDRCPAVRLAIANTDKALIEWVAERWRGNIDLNGRQGSLGSKPVWMFRAQGDDFLAVLAAAQPYLLVKARQASLATELIATRPARRPYLPEVKEHRLVLARQISELNRGGTPPRGMPAGTRRRGDQTFIRPDPPDDPAEV